MSMLNIDDLNNKIKKKEADKQEIYDMVLKKCHYRIKKTAEYSNMYCCFYVIPKYICGYPIYDYKACLMYMIYMLTKNGFEIKYTHPNLLFISWLNKSNTKYVKTKKAIGSYKKIDDIELHSNGLYNTQSLKLLGNKINNLN